MNPQRALDWGDRTDIRDASREATGVRAGRPESSGIHPRLGSDSRFREKVEGWAFLSGFLKTLNYILTHMADKKPNNQRSEVLNPTSDAFKAAADNRSNQLNANNPAYKASRERK